MESVAFSPDGKLLASSDGWRNGLPTFSEIKIWDPASGQAIRTLVGHRETNVDLAFSPDGKKIVSGGQIACLRSGMSRRGGSL